MRLHWETKNFYKYNAINKMKKGYCLNVCTKKKTSEEVRDTETAEGRNSKYYLQILSTCLAVAQIP